jgi:hypothetical protein
MILNKFNRIGLILIVLLIALGSVGWVQTPSPTQAIFPAQGEPAGLTVEVTGPASVEVDDTFEVIVVATNIPEPGMFGYQLTLNWDNAVFSSVNVTTSPDFPVLARTELAESSYEIAASRQGDVGDVTDAGGPVMLLAVEFQANLVTEPNASSLTLSGVKVGRKGGINVPVDTVINLDVVVEEADGDLLGNVQAEGRPDDNQAGHSVVGEGDLSTVTDANGDFILTDTEFGTYDLTADSPGFLASTCQGIIHENAETPLEGVELLAGDIDDTGGIDITDAVAIGAAFGSTNSGEVANLNLDEEVDILDLILMAANFGQTSEANPWLCQAAGS